MVFNYLALLFLHNYCILISVLQLLTNCNWVGRHVFVTKTNQLSLFPYS